MGERTIGHYRVVDKLAAGGMGVVYRAEDLTLHRAVALKFLTPDTSADEEYRARFLREARVAAALNHPNTCTVYEVGEVAADAADAQDPVAPPGTPFIAMEFIDGETLAAWLGRAGQLTVREALDVAVQIAEGLAEAHRRQIVHRDLKPHNVMVTGDRRVKIVDFGLAKPLRPARGAKATMSTSEMISADLGDRTLIGTCAYMSPEQAVGKPVDARSDVFAFGIMLYQLVTGHLPFRGETATEILAKILEAEPEPVHTTKTRAPSALARIVDRCLEKKPEDRYQETSDLVADLKEAQQAWHRASHWSGAWRRLDRRQLVAAAVVLAVAVTLAYVGLPRWGKQRQGATTTTTVEKQVTTAPSPQPGPTPPAERPKSEEQQPDVKPPAPPTESGTTEARTRVVTSPSTRTVATEQRSARSATLIVTSTPKASVNLDGSLVGVTPLTLEIAAGTHELTMTSADGLRWRGRTEVAAGQIVTVHRELNLTGRLTITSDIWIEVSLDGGPPEQTPVQFTKVATGLHEVRASREGFVTQVLEIFIEEGKTTTVRVTLEKKS